ncbi:MAG: flagellar hook-associated protein 3 [Ruminococcaceae bacterium]|jgi:flagellar hook-associated protein 3|nr:flagellar hook-associated protein 3 [Oscillospiraceae bacterium]
MRVTQGMLTRSFLKNINTNLSNRAKSQEKIESGKKFSRSSENLSDAARALKVREELYANKKYLSNIENVQSRLSAAETNLSSINSVLVTAWDKMQKALTDTSTNERDILAQEVDSLKDEVLQFANSQFSDKYLFGGSNNGSAPFTEDSATGKILYNGVPVDNIKKDTDGTYYYYKTPADEAGDIKTAVPENSDVYLDIGLGLNMTGSTVDPRSAFKVSFSGLDIFGCGTDSETGLPNNVFSLLSNAVDTMNSQPMDSDQLSQISDFLKTKTQKVLLSITDIGTKTNFLDNSANRLENDILNLTTAQQTLEITDDTSETIQWKMYDYAYKATLQMGSKVLPLSLMDFIS